VYNGTHGGTQKSYIVLEKSYTIHTFSTSGSGLYFGFIVQLIFPVSRNWSVWHQCPLCAVYLESSDSVDCLGFDMVLRDLQLVVNLTILFQTTQIVSTCLSLGR